MVRRITRVALLAAAIMAVAVPAADATSPGANGKIAFSSNRTGNYDIYTMNADGSDVTRLTSAPEEDLHPAWSPDGKKIAFFRYQSQTLYVMNADGTGQTSLDVWTLDGEPSWTPDGSRIAYTRHDFGCDSGGCYVGPREIRAVNPDGTGEAPIITSETCGYNYNSGYLYLHRFSPVWSPTGSRIAFSASGCITDPQDDENSLEDPTGDVGVANADGTGESYIAGNDYPWDPEWYYGAAQPTWSPRNDRIAYSADAQEPWNSDGIHAVGATGGGRVALTVSADSAPAWSPDGAKIAFVRTSGGYQSLWLMNADGSNEHQIALPSTAWNDVDPDWQPLGAFDVYPRPGGGSPQRVPLVPSYEKCTAPNSQHVEPLDEPSCTPPALTSQVLTTGTAGRGQGSARLDAVQGDSHNPRRRGRRPHHRPRLRRALQAGERRLPCGSRL